MKFILYINPYLPKKKKKKLKVLLFCTTAMEQL